MVSFKISRDDARIVRQIVDRAMQLGVGVDGLTLEMDIAATHANGCPLNLYKFLHSKRFDFGHDIAGIQRHIDRNTGQLRDCFLPRCARPSKAKATR